MVSFSCVPLKASRLKDFNFASRDIQKVVVNSEQGQKGHENAGSAEKVPKVVAVKEVQNGAVSVLKRIKKI